MLPTAGDAAGAVPAAGLAAGQFLGGRGHTDHRKRPLVALHVTVQTPDQSQRIGPVRLDPGAQLIPVLRTDDHVRNAQGDQVAMEPVPQRPGFLTAVHRFALVQLLPGPDQKILGGELLGGLGSGVVQLPDHPVAVGMNVDAELDALGFASALCFSRRMGIGIGLHTTWV